MYILIFLFLLNNNYFVMSHPPLFTETTFTTDIDTLTVQELVDHTDQADTSSFLQAFDRVRNLLL